MRNSIMMVAAVLLAACTTKASAPADSTATTTTSAPPLDSTVQHKAPPDSLFRGDGAKCVVRPAVKWSNVELGQPYPCNWSK